MKQVSKVLSDSLIEIANAIEGGYFNKKIKIGLTLYENDYGLETILEGAKLAKSSLYEIVLIGKKIDNCDFEFIEVDKREYIHKKMDTLLKEKYINAAVTMNYTFPIGVSSVGKISSPGKGKEVLLATTTGASATNRVEAMIKNTIYGIIVAKTIGIENPTVGILNVDGSRLVEQGLMELKNNGYDIHFAKSVRNENDCIMRGNDVLLGTSDIIVTDTLTGNLIMKMCGCFNSGGRYEAIGCGYGPGIGFDYDKNILIVSKTSGSKVISNAIKYAFDVVKGNINEIKRKEFESVNKARMQEVFFKLNRTLKKTEIINTTKEIVNTSIYGIDITNLDDAVEILKKSDIYGESAMGCVGPIILINKSKVDLAIKILHQNGYTSYKSDIY